MAEFDALIAGYRRFRTGAYVDQRQRYDQLSAEGQRPRTMIIACSDSRVDPTSVFDGAPGQLFVVRNVANLVPPYETDRGYHSASAAIEFAVTHLKVEELIVLGHAQCGGITASLTGRYSGADHGAGGFIDHWMAMIEPARAEAIAHARADPGIDVQESLELAAIRLSLANLRSFPFVAARADAGLLVLRGAHFGIADGTLRVLDPATDRFAPVGIDDRPR